MLSKDSRRTYASIYLAYCSFLIEQTGQVAPVVPERILETALPLLPQVTPEVVAAYRDALRDRGRKPAAVNTHLAAISTLHSRLPGPNPAAASAVRRLRTPALSATKFLTAEQAQEVVARLGRDETLLGVRDYAVVVTLLLTGFRRRELVSLDVEDIVDHGGYPVVHAVVKGGGTRLVELVPGAMEAIGRWLTASAVVTGPLFVPLAPRTLAPQRGKRLSVESVAAIVRARCGVAPHGLRHTHTTLALQAGAKLEDVQRWIGHANPRTTARYYHPGDFTGRSPARLIDLGLEEKEPCDTPPSEP